MTSINLYESLFEIRPYFFSMREISLNDPIFSLDIKIPLNWHYTKIVTEYESLNIMYKEQDKSSGSILLSLLTKEITPIGLSNLFKCAKDIITYNLEELEKLKLLEEKIEQLKNIFDSSPLSKLKAMELLGISKTESKNEN